MNSFPMKSPLIFVPTLKLVRNATLSAAQVLTGNTTTLEAIDIYNFSLHVSCFSAHDAAGELGL